MSERLPIAVLVSGAGTNLGALLEQVHGREAEVVAVGSNVADAAALERARAHDVPTGVFAASSFENRQARDRALAEWLLERGTRLVVLAGYMELLCGAFLDRFPGAVINVHPSLLPAFPGLDAIGQALAHGVKVFGVTIHFVDAGVDSGPIILQRGIALTEPGSASEVHDQLRPIEHELLCTTVRLYAADGLRLDPENPRRVLIGR